MSHETPHNHPSRRAFLRAGLAGAGASLLGSHALARAGAPLSVPPTMLPTMLVVIELRGGNDALNTIVPHRLPSYAARRGSTALTAAETLPLDAGLVGIGGYGMHPALPNLHRLWRGGQLAWAHKVGYPQPNGSHFMSLDVLEHGVRGDFASLGIPRSGWVARYADRHAADPFGAIQVGNGRPTAVMGGDTMLARINGLANYVFNNDPLYWESQLHRQETVRTMLGRVGTEPTRGGRAATLQAIDLVPRVQAAVAAHAGVASYPNTPIGRALSDISVLMHADFGTRIFYTGFEGFDTHANQGTVTGTQATLLGELDQALAAFERDSLALGSWYRTVVAIVSEFGRRNYSNASGGTDHGEAGLVMLTGGTVRGGQYGTAPTDQDLAQESMPHDVDFRSVYEEILTKHLGVQDPAPIFPEPRSNRRMLGFL